MEPFDPLFQNPHWQTIASHYWPRPPGLEDFPEQRRLIQTEPDVQVLVVSQQPVGAARGDVVLVHGLEGTGDAGYMRSLALAALRAGFAAHRFHLRTCGGTEHLCRTLYHAGLTSDLLAFLRTLDSAAFVVGFSLGGNVVLKLAGESGSTDILRGVCGVSVPLDLGACARRIHEPDNWLYERRFVERMKERLCATGRYRKADFAGLRSVMDLDDKITAPSFGFGNAGNYYRTQSAIRFLPGIRVPCLLIQAKDDTFIPFDVYGSEAVRSNPCIEVLSTRYGGHLGFLARDRRQRFWVDRVIMNWILKRLI